MDLLYVFAKFALFLWVVKSTLFWVAFWQQKEYRMDRVLIHLSETRQGRSTLFSPLALLKWFIIFSYAFVISHDELANPYEIVVFAVLFFQALLVCRDILTNKLAYPVFTIKAELITFSVFLLVFLFSIVPLTDQSLWLLLIDRSIALFTAGIVLLSSFPTELYRDIQISKAMKKIKKVNVCVIAIAGSYGKSSTKEFVAQILEKKFKVLKTYGSQNTHIGIAHTILKKLRDDTQIFVVEMSSYKRGEIQELCSYLKPTMGILTSVNKQHLSFFENEQDAVQAKYELIESLPRKGLALFNGNNPITYTLYKQTRKNKRLYYREFLPHETAPKKSALPKNGDITATNIVVAKKSISFDIVTQKGKFHVTAPLLGAHNIENILPAVSIAEYFGMREKDMKQTIAKLVPLPHTMSYHSFATGAALIDDTFNTNPTAVYAAFNYMKIYSKQKIMVLQPLIELGKHAREEHFKIGQEIGKTCDYLFLTNKNFYRAIIQGVQAAGGRCVVLVQTPEQIESFISSSVHKDDVVVFEGREAAASLENLLSR